MAPLLQTDNRKKQTDKQIGCMSGFLQIFDRQQILAGKRIHSSKRLPPSTGVGESKESTSVVDSREICHELKKPEPNKQVGVVLSASPDSCFNHRGIGNSPLVKPSNETGRLSLDSERRSPSVIARLMGLESLSFSEEKSAKFVEKPELTRSNSESRVSRDLIRSKYIDRNNFQVKVPSLLHKQENIVRDEKSNVNLESSRSLFDSTYFSDGKKKNFLSVERDFDKFKIKESEEPISDLTTLRQILEVLQLKGLLHSSKNRESFRSFVFDKNSPSDSRRFGHDYRVRRSSPTRIKSNLKSCNPIVKRKPLSIEIRKRANESFERNSQIGSPNIAPKRTGSVHHSVNNRSPKNYEQTESVSVNSRKQKFNKNIVRRAESSSVSESIFNTPSKADSEKSKFDGCKDGRNLLERCDRLLHSIAEMNMNDATESPPSSTMVLPSPVSVLESGFEKDELWSPSTSIDFKVTSVDNFKDDTSVRSISPTISTQPEEEFTSNDPEFVYISKILQTSKQLNIDSNIFYSLEKNLRNTENTLSKRERKLIFDVIIEILDKNRDLPPWKALNEDLGTPVKRIWTEFQKIREVNCSDDISVVLKKDLVEMNGWGDRNIEMTETVLDVERMIFKGLVSEMIEDLVEFSGKCVFLRTQRRLVF